MRQCSNAYRNPPQFFQTYIYFFRDLSNEEYLSKSTDPRRTLFPEILDGKLTLNDEGRLLPLSMKESIDHWLAMVLRKLSEVPRDKWNAPMLQETLNTIYSDIEPHPNMLASEFRQKKLDVMLFLRWALTAGWSGPSNPVAMDILGPELTVRRLNDAAALIVGD